MAAFQPDSIQPRGVSGMVAIATNGTLQQWELIKHPFLSATTEQACPITGDAQFSLSCTQKSFQERANQIGRDFFALGSKLYKHWQRFSLNSPAVQSIPGASIPQEPFNQIVTTIQSTPASMNLVGQIRKGVKLTSVSCSGDHSLMAIADNIGTVEL